MSRESHVAGMGAGSTAPFRNTRTNLVYWKIKWPTRAAPGGAPPPTSWMPIARSGVCLVIADAALTGLLTKKGTRQDRRVARPLSPLAAGFASVRRRGPPRASFSHSLTAPSAGSHNGGSCELSLARGCYNLAPRRTFTSNAALAPSTPARATPSLRQPRGREFLPEMSPGGRSTSRSLRERIIWFCMDGP